MFKLEKLKNLDFWFIGLILLFIIIGGLTVYSSTYFMNDSVSQLFFNQIFFYAIGIIIFLILSVIEIKKLNNHFIIFAVTLFSTFLLLFVLFFGNSAFGAQRWIDIGIFTIQPSEFAKIFLILTTAYCLSPKRNTQLGELFNIYKTKGQSTKLAIINLIKQKEFVFFTLNVVYLLITLFLVIKQRSLGNSVLIFLIFSIMLVSRMKFKVKYLIGIIPIVLGLIIGTNIIQFDNLYLALNIHPEIGNFDLLIFSIFLIILIFIARNFKFNLAAIILLFIVSILSISIFNLAYNNLLEPYQRQRITSFLNPTEESSLSEDYNRQKSIEAIGSSQLLGKGFLKGNITNAGLLPFAFTDFVFAAYSEQFGFVGSLILLILFYLLITKIISISNQSQDTFSSLIALGVAMMILFNTLQHVGMNLGITPITGVPLPLISYGGSSVIVVFIGLGLVNSINLDNMEVEKKVTRFLV